MPHEKHAKNSIFGYKEQHIFSYRKENTNLDLGCVPELVESFQTKEEDIEGPKKTVCYVIQFHSRPSWFLKFQYHIKLFCSKFLI